MLRAAEPRCFHGASTPHGTRMTPAFAPDHTCAQPPLGTKPKGLKRSATGAAAQEQPPPMAVLSMADAIFKALREDGLGRTVVAQGESSDDDDDDDDDDDEPQQAAAGSAQAGGAIASEGSSAATDAGTSSEGGETSGAANEASISGGGAPGGAGCDGLAGKKRSAPAKEVKKEHRDIGIDEDPLVAIVRQAEEDNMRLQWPRRPNFRSVLAIGYRDTDSFRWHTDLAGDEGWVCSISVGAKAIFEYLPTAAPSALRRARAKAAEDTVRVEIDSGDAVLFNGGLLPHRVASVQPVAEPGEGADPALQAMMAPYVRLNLQVRVYGAGESFGLHQLLRRGYDYIR